MRQKVDTELILLVVISVFIIVLAAAYARFREPALSAPAATAGRLTTLEEQGTTPPVGIQETTPGVTIPEGALLRTREQAIARAIELARALGTAQPHLVSVELMTLHDALFASQLQSGEAP